MNAVVGVFVDNIVFVTTAVVILVSIFAVILWRRKRQTNESNTAVDEYFTEDVQPRSKKAVKSKPKKTKSEKMKTSIANGHLPNMQDASVTKPSEDASKPAISLPAEKQQKSQAVKQKANKKQPKLSPKTEVSEYEAGEWTEVPSRKKMKAKKEGSEMTNDNRASNESVDQLQQESHNMKLDESKSAADANDMNAGVDMLKDIDVIEKSSVTRDEETKEVNTPAASLAVVTKTSRNAEKKKARKQKAAAAAAEQKSQSLDSENSFIDVDNDTVMGEINRPVENSISEVTSPVSSSRVPEPEPVVTKQNSPSVPESIDMVQNVSIPDAIVTSASSEMPAAKPVLSDQPSSQKISEKHKWSLKTGDVMPAAVNKRKKKVRRDN